MGRQAFLFDNDSSQDADAIARIVVHLPVEGLFDYRIPADLREQVLPGVRVRVAFGGRKVIGTCTALCSSSKVQDPKEIIDVVDREPLLSPALIELSRWIATHYQCGWWEALAAALPAVARRGGGLKKVLVVRLTLPLDEAQLLADELLPKRPEQSRCLRILAEEGGRLEAVLLRRRANVSRSPVDTLKKQGHLAFEWIEEERQPRDDMAEPDKGPVQLTGEQERALGEILERLGEPGSARFLLFGVTGSGKTEVYLRAIREVVAQGRQAIVLVPEISLTPQTVARFKHRFDRVAVLHSRLTDAERYTQWLAIRSGRADVVVGARSALFAPVPHLGLIVVDEEHETSFKQQSTPRYHARNVALKRGQLEGAPVVLGSATPSLEAYLEVRAGSMILLELKNRVGGGTFPATTILDLGLQKSRWTFLTDHLFSALENTLAAGHQAILFLNRRGYHTALFCPRCGEPVRCPECEIALTYHRGSNRVMCHYCGHESFPLVNCPACRTQKLRYIGSGTERVQTEVQRAFPAARILRMDSDTMSTRHAHGEALECFRRREADLLIGTQMIAKGLDFPSVTLVGVISADTSLLLPDFRAAERTFQLIAQVSGRAGRGEQGGRVVVQTYNPDHYAIKLAVDGNYERFVDHELAARKEMGYPPYGRLLRLVVSAEAESDVMRLTRAAADALREASLPEGTRILGPARAPITKISGRFRWHLMVKSPGEQGIAEAGRILKETRRRENSSLETARMQIDVDPLSML